MMNLVGYAEDDEDDKTVAVQSSTPNNEQQETNPLFLQLCEKLQQIPGYSFVEKLKSTDTFWNSHLLEFICEQHQVDKQASHFDFAGLVATNNNKNHKNEHEIIIGKERDGSHSSNDQPVAERASSKEITVNQREKA